MDEKEQMVMRAYVQTIRRQEAEIRELKEAIHDVMIWAKQIVDRMDRDWIEVLRGEGEL